MDSEIAKRFEVMAKAIARLERKTDFILQQLNLEYIDNAEESVPPQLAQVAALLKQGKKLQAIQAYRKLTDASLEEAQLAVQKLELGQAGK